MAPKKEGPQQNGGGKVSPTPPPGENRPRGGEIFDDNLLGKGARVSYWGPKKYPREGGSHKITETSGGKKGATT